MNARIFALSAAWGVCLALSAVAAWAAERFRDRAGWDAEPWRDEFLEQYLEGLRDE